MLFFFQTISLVNSPTKSITPPDVPIKETISKAHTTTVRKSPKRRPMQRHAVISSSSSSESLPPLRGMQISTYIFK